MRPAISEHGGTVVFASLASNLVPDDANGFADVFVRFATGSTVRASVASDGSEANGPSSNPDVSADGRYVVFQSSASNLVTGDTNGQADVFVRDLSSNTTELVSVAREGGPGNGSVRRTRHQR